MRGASWSAVAAGATANVTADGTTWLQFRALDKAGQDLLHGRLRAPDPTAEAMVDTLPPSLPVLTGASGAWANTASVIVQPTGTPADAGSGFAGYEYRTSNAVGSTGRRRRTRAPHEHGLRRGPDAGRIPCGGGAATNASAWAPATQRRRQHRPHRPQRRRAPPTLTGGSADVAGRPRRPRSPAPARPTRGRASAPTTAVTSTHNGRPHVVRPPGSVGPSVTVTFWP